MSTLLLLAEGNAINLANRLDWRCFRIRDAIFEHQDELPVRIAKWIDPARGTSIRFTITSFALSRFRFGTTTAKQHTIVSGAGDGRKRVLPRWETFGGLVTLPGERPFPVSP